MGMPSIFLLLLNVQHILMFHLTFHILKALTYIKPARKCKSILSLSDYKQKTIEHFLGIEREDMYSGGELIDIYRKFAAKPSDTAHNEYRKLLLLHNHDDIEGC